MTTLPACDDWPPFAREAHRRLMVAAFGEKPGLRFRDHDGLPLSGGVIYVYESGTTIPATTYSDSNLLWANSNPVIADAQGRAPIFFAANKTYDLAVHNAKGEQVSTVFSVRT